MESFNSEEFLGSYPDIIENEPNSLALNEFMAQKKAEIEKLSDEVVIKNLQIASLKNQTVDAFRKSPDMITEVPIGWPASLDEGGPSGYTMNLPFAEFGGPMGSYSRMYGSTLSDDVAIDLAAPLDDGGPGGYTMNPDPPFAGIGGPMHSDSRVDESLQFDDAAHIEKLNEKVKELTVAKEQLETRNRKLDEESSYAKGLAAGAAVELKAISSEVAKLISRIEKLTAGLENLRFSSGIVQEGDLDVLDIVDEDQNCRMCKNSGLLWRLRDRAAIEYHFSVVDHNAEEMLLRKTC